MMIIPQQTQFPDIQQLLQQILASRKQEGVQQGLNMPQMQANIQNMQGLHPGALSSLSKISELFGYEPNTMFGYNLGGTGLGSAPKNLKEISALLGV